MFNRVSSSDGYPMTAAQVVQRNLTIPIHKDSRLRPNENWNFSFELSFLGFANWKRNQTHLDLFDVNIGSNKKDFPAVKSVLLRNFYIRARVRPYIRDNLRSIRWSFFPFCWYHVVFPNAPVKPSIWEDEGPTRNSAKGKPWSSNRSISQHWLQSWVRSLWCRN